MLKKLMSFDLETVPDLELIRSKYPKYEKYSDIDAVYDLRASYNNDFLPAIYHKILSISVTYFDASIQSDKLLKASMAVSTFDGVDEKEKIKKFISFFDSQSPTLMGWNSKGFDVQVLNYRMLKYMIVSNILNRNEGEYKYDNYTNRYHNRHIDLMDKIGCFSGRANANLETICISLGLPGKFSFNRDQLFEDWLEGKYKEIDEYCETDTLNVMIIYTKWLYVTGMINSAVYVQLEMFIRRELKNSGKAHLIEFESRWKER